MTSAICFLIPKKDTARANSLMEVLDRGRGDFHTSPKGDCNIHVLVIYENPEEIQEDFYTSIEGVQWLQGKMDPYSPFGVKPPVPKPIFSAYMAK